MKNPGKMNIGDWFDWIKAIGYWIKALRPSQFIAIIAFLVALSTAAFSYCHSNKNFLGGTSIGLFINNLVGSNIFNPNSKNTYENVYLVGSGTVRKYLAENASDVAKESTQIWNDAGVILHILEGATGTGIKLLTDSPSEQNILAMASDRQTFLDDINSPESVKLRFFEVFLGADQLQVIIVAKNKDELKQFFPKLFNKDKISLDDLRKLVWDVGSKKEPKHNVWITDSPSATRKFYAKKLNVGKDFSEKWFNEIHWEPTHGSLSGGDRLNPFIALGSKVLNSLALDIKEIDNTPTRLKVLDVVDGTKAVKRELFLYGKVDTVDTKENGSKEVWTRNINPAISWTIKQLLNKLKGSNGITRDCIASQIEYFKLESLKPGWVYSNAIDDGFYHSNGCRF